MQVEPLSAAVGARVTGVDLSSELDAASIEALRVALDEHHVLAFPNQDLTPERHVEVGEWFGTPYIHPYLTPVDAHPAILEVRKEADETEVFGGQYWHADITFSDPPAAASLLYSLDIPPIGGDTLFANQHLAFERLSVGMQTMLGGLNAVHCYPGKTEDEASAVHPVLRLHPRTRRPALYINAAFVSRFENMTEDESKPLLDFLFAHQTRPEFQLRLGWTARMLTIWDNRSVLHYAMNDHHGYRRELQRVTSIEFL